MIPVTIVIPAFNPGRFMLPALRSIIYQGFKSWEAIVVDDGSLEDISWVKKVDPRIRYLQQRNQGQAAARNAGIENSEGRYIAFLDQDDLWLPGKLERQVELLEENEAMVACHTQFELIDAEGSMSGAGFGRSQSYEQMLEGTGICGASTVMVRRSALTQAGGFNDQDRPAEDLDLWLRLARMGAFGFIDELLVQYRIHGENQSLRYRQLFRAIRAIQLRQLHRVPEMRDRVMTGIRNYRRDAAGKAFEQLRRAVRKRSVYGIATHAAFVMKHQPGLLAHAIVGRFRGAPAMSSAEMPISR